MKLNLNSFIGVSYGQTSTALVDARLSPEHASFKARQVSMYQESGSGSPEGTAMEMGFKCGTKVLKGITKTLQRSPSWKVKSTGYVAEVFVGAMGKQCKKMTMDWLKSESDNRAD